MTRNELKAKMREKRKQIRKLQSRAIAPGVEVEELRSMSDQMKTLQDEMDHLEEQLDTLEEDGIGELNPLELRKLQPGYRPWMEEENRSLAKFSVGNVHVSTPSIMDGLALRSGETMVSRLCRGRKPLDLGKYIRGMVTGSWDSAVEERAAFTTTATGVIIPDILSAHIIDTARNVSLFGEAGVPIVPMASGNMTIARVKEDPVFSFKEEAEEQKEGNNFELEGVQLKSKTAYGYCYVSLEAIHSAQNLTGIIQQVFSQEIADCIDKGMLYGQNTNATAAPSGIMNDENVHHITATNSYYTDFVRAIGAVRKSNGNPSILGINAGTEEIFSLLMDSTGQPLIAPKAVDALKRIVSNQLAGDETEGYEALIFDPMAMVIGMQNNITVRMFQDTDYCIKNGMVGFQIYAMLDCAAVMPSHISKITGIKSPEML